MGLREEEHLSRENRKAQGPRQESIKEWVLLCEWKGVLEVGGYEVLE